MKVTESEFRKAVDAEPHEVKRERDTEYSHDNYLRLDAGRRPLVDYDDDGEPLGLIGFISYHSHRPTEYHLVG